MTEKCPFSDETLINARCEIKKRTEIGEDYCQGECPLRNKVTVEDIIGLVKCEPTNSVEEVRKLRGRETKTEKRFTLKEHLINEYGLLDNEKEIAYVDHQSAFTICDLLNKQHEENDLLKQQLKTKVIVNKQYEENKKLKRALLFYLDLAIQDSSYLKDGFEKGMELWCQRLFNCSYAEMKKEYEDFEWADVWEMGE